MLKKKNWIHPIIAFSAIMILQIACGLQQDRLVKVEGYSMAPNLVNGDILKIVETPLSELKRGDVVLVETKDNNQLKRIIGLPNETISIHDGKIFIDGTELIESYEVFAPDYIVDEIKLDSDSYFVLGDNRPNSSDSHLYGPIKGSAIKGKAIIWQLSSER